MARSQDPVPSGLRAKSVRPFKGYPKKSAAESAKRSEYATAEGAMEGSHKDTILWESATQLSLFVLFDTDLCITILVLAIVERKG